MKRKTIAVDMDDVLADAYGRIIEIFEKQNGFVIDQAAKGKKYSEVFTEENLAIAQKIPHEENFFQNLDVIENSKEFMMELYKKHDVHRISSNGISKVAQSKKRLAKSTFSLYPIGKR